MRSLRNATHIKCLREYLVDDIPMFSLIVFSERCELKKVTVEDENIHVIKRDRTYATVRKIWDNADDMLKEDEVEALYEKLQVLTNQDKATKEKHIENIDKKRKK